jgi:quercetin 2,3-dioxygenase
MPAITADTLVLPRIDRPAATSRRRPVSQLVRAQRAVEGAGFVVRRAIPSVEHRFTDPFLLLDHMGEVDHAPGEAKGAPDHPHRGFETVTYLLDGALEHRDSTGSGGVIRDGGTQWMTAGGGIVHSEMPTERLVREGGLLHGVQLWVNLPAHEKLVTPRYQDIGADRLTLVSSADGGALVRIVAGEVAGHHGPGATHTPIAYAHATLAPGARLDVPWRSDFNALVYVLAGKGTAGDGSPIEEGVLAVMGDGDHVTITADAHQDSRSGSLEVLLLGGAPIRQPVAWYGPFVMNTRAEIMQAVDDYQSGRMGSIPPISVG